MFWGRHEKICRKRPFGVDWAIALLALMVPLATASAGSIVGSSHDLSTGTDGICIYCHVSTAAASDGAAPLWNRKASSETMEMYKSATLDMTIASSPGDVSLMCLSCHDGSMAFDSLINNPGVGNSGRVSGVMAIGADGLGNDHPISITYDPAKDTAFVPATNGKVGDLPLFARDGEGEHPTQVECSTCHDAHDPSRGNFLRVSNAGSRLCLTCHIK